MSSKGHVHDNSVVERRLRPIYDWLDGGNNRKALQECEKVLKKTPALQCAKALKALTLHRMGKEKEAVDILDVLTEESPTDDATLQAMTLCYRELQQLEKNCRLYETAVKLDPNNEELVTHLFMSYARIFDYKSQQKTAMTLYKNKAKTPYYCWAVMSIVLQATRGEGRCDTQKRALLLSLAERMMEKLVTDGKLEAEQEVQLYVMVLELQQKYKEVLAVLEGPLAVKLACSSAPQDKLKYYALLEKWEDVNHICKAILVESVDRWNIWKEYINSVFKLMDKRKSGQGGGDEAIAVNNHENDNGDGSGEVSVDSPDDTPDKCHEFICHIVETGAENGFWLRAPYLARFELCTQLLAHRLDPMDVLGDVIELFIEYFRKFAHKPCCVSDMRHYLRLLDEEKRTDLATRLLKDVGVSATHVPQSEQQMQRHICAIQMSRLCGGHRHLVPMGGNTDIGGATEHLRAMVTAYSLHYQHGFETYGTILLNTDLGPSDAYALMAAHVLYDIAMLEQSSDEIVAALVLLENLLKNSPSNFHAKLLGVRLYHTVGGVLGAQAMYNALDTKHIQLDSLGYIHCARLPASGFFLSPNLLDVTLKFYSSNYKDSSDHITFSYKYGSFTKLDEFMDFRERLNNSFHYTSTAADRIVVTLIECCNLDKLYQVDISPRNNQIEWDLLRDNQDLSVYTSWDPERITCPPEDLPEIHDHFVQNKTFLQIRTSVLWCLATAADVVKCQDGVRQKHLLALVKLLDEFDSNVKEAKARNFVPLRQNQVTLPLPSRLHVALDTPHYAVVGMAMRFLVRLEGSGSGDESSGGGESGGNLQESLQTILDQIEKDAQEALERLKVRTKQTNLCERRVTMEYVVNLIEILSIATLVCLLCHDLIKPPALNSKKGKKKAPESPLKEWVVSLSRILEGAFDTLGAILRQWSELTVACDLAKLLESLNVNEDGRSVCEHITNSYTLACSELQNVLKAKAKMLNAVLL